MSMMAASTRSPSAVLIGFRPISIGTSLPSLRRPKRSRPAPIGRASFFQTASARPMGAGRDLFGRRKDGSEVPIEIGLNPISTAEGDLVLAAIIDISERKRAEQELAHVREQLDHELAGLRSLH